MKKRNFRKYLAYVKEQRQTAIADYFLEKDYVLSDFLSTWQSLRQTGQMTSSDSLIFKGGTLLARNYLNYPRISEDLDFTHADSNMLRLIENENKREQEIKKRVLPILEDVQTICDTAGFDFHQRRTDPRYVQVRNSRAVYVLHFYYTSLITHEEIPVKIEINFLEHVLYPCPESRINMIVEMDTFLKSIDYDLIPLSMKTYALDEIVLEKYRALLTRASMKERDIFDLYLIHQRGCNALSAPVDTVHKKIQSGILIAPDTLRNLQKQCSLLQSTSCFESEDDISSFTLVTIKKEPYDDFKNHIVKKLMEICTTYKYTPC